MDEVIHYWNEMKNFRIKLLIFSILTQYIYDYNINYCYSNNHKNDEEIVWTEERLFNSKTIFFL